MSLGVEEIDLVLVPRKCTPPQTCGHMPASCQGQRQLPRPGLPALSTVYPVLCSGDESTLSHPPTLSQGPWVTGSTLILGLPGGAKPEGGPNALLCPGSLGGGQLSYEAFPSWPGARGGERGLGG